MSKAEFLDEPPRLTKTKHQEIRLILAELDSDDWCDNVDPLTDHQRALFEARLATYTKDPHAGRTWEEVEGRIRARLAAAERISRDSLLEHLLRPDILMPLVDQVAILSKSFGYLLLLLNEMPVDRVTPAPIHKNERPSFRWPCLSESWRFTSSYTPETFVMQEINGVTHA